MVEIVVVDALGIELPLVLEERRLLVGHIFSYSVNVDRLIHFTVGFRSGGWRAALAHLSQHLLLPIRGQILGANGPAPLRRLPLRFLAEQMSLADQLRGG